MSRVRYIAHMSDQCPAVAGRAWETPDIGRNVRYAVIANHILLLNYCYSKASRDSLLSYACLIKIMRIKQRSAAGGLIKIYLFYSASVVQVACSFFLFTVINIICSISISVLDTLFLYIDLETVFYTTRLFVVFFLRGLDRLFGYRIRKHLSRESNHPECAISTSISRL